MNTYSTGTWKAPVIDLKSTGKNIAKLRTAAGLSVKDLQRMLGLAKPQAIYKWQNGDCLPTIDNLVILAAALGVTLNDLLVIDGDSPDINKRHFCTLKLA